MTHKSLVILVILGMAILLPILFGLAYFLGDRNYIIALLLLFGLLSTDIFVSLQLIDKTLNHP